MYIRIVRIVLCICPFFRFAGYAGHLRIFLIIWFALLPLALVESSGWLTIVWVPFIAVSSIRSALVVAQIVAPIYAASHIHLHNVCQQHTNNKACIRGNMYYVFVLPSVWNYRYGDYVAGARWSVWISVQWYVHTFCQPSGICSSQRRFDLVVVLTAHRFCNFRKKNVLTRVRHPARHNDWGDPTRCASHLPKIH